MKSDSFSESNLYIKAGDFCFQCNNIKPHNDNNFSLKQMHDKTDVTF